MTEGYKQTEIGMIPEDWEVKSLKDIAPLQRGFDLPYSQMKEGKYPVVFSNGIGAYHERYMVNGPGVITGRSGTIGNVHFVPQNYWPHNTSLWVTDFRGNDEKYVYYLFQTIPWELYNSGSGVPTLNRNDVHDTLHAVPPPTEQRRIAEALSDMDELIASLEKLIAKKKAIKQGAMQELLTGKRRLPGFSGEWVAVKLGDIVTDIRTGSRNNEEKSENGKYPFFVRSQRVERIESYSFDCEAILVPGEGNIGSTFHYINGKFDCHQRVYKISGFEKVDAKFIFYYMQQFFGKHALSNTVKATVDSLRLPTFQEFQLLIPNEITEQKQIACFISDLDDEITVLHHKLEISKQIKQGMMQQLLMGKIRFV